MNLLIDTHAITWFITEDDQLPIRIKALIEDPSDFQEERLIYMAPIQCLYWVFRCNSRSYGWMSVWIRAAVRPLLSDVKGKHTINFE